MQRASYRNHVLFPATLLGSGIVAALRHCPQFRVEASSAPAPRTGALAPPDAIVLAAPADGSLLAVLEQLHTAYPAAKLIIVYSSDELRHLPTLLRLGACGFLLASELTGAALARVLGAILEQNCLVLSGDLSAHWQARLLERRTASPPAPPLPSMLDDLRVTDRAVLAALLRGEPRTRIARANGLSLTSLNRAIRRLKDAAGVETLAELCAAAARLGLTDDATIVPFRPPRRTG